MSARKLSTLIPAAFAAAALFLVLLPGAAPLPASPVEVSISVFHDQLAPHGRWVTASSYGSVWIPNGVAAGWQPYVDGQWMYSDYGWTWEADDPWGDVPYHYGTWAWVDPHGWVWIPGTVWAPAWVTWAYTDDYVGWAPVPPTFALTATGYFGPAVVVPAARYVFVPAPKFVGVRVASVRVPAAQSAVIVNRSVRTTRFEVQQGVVRVAGPPPQKIERAVGHPLERVSVERLHVRPTSIQAAGVTNGKSVRVVAPEKERAQLSAEKNVSPKSASKNASREAQEAKTSKSKQTHPASAHEAHRAESAQAEAKPSHSKAKTEKTTEHHAVKPEKAAEPPKELAAPAHVAAKPHSQVEAKPRAEVEAQPRSNVEAQPQAEVKPRPEPQQHPAPAPPKAQPQKAQVQKEKPQPPKDDSKGN